MKHTGGSVHFKKEDMFVKDGQRSSTGQHNHFTSHTMVNRTKWSLVELLISSPFKQEHHIMYFLWKLQHGHRNHSDHVHLWASWRLQMRRGMRTAGTISGTSLPSGQQLSGASHSPNMGPGNVLQHLLQNHQVPQQLFFALNSHQTPSGFTAALFWLALQSCTLTVNWMTNKLYNSLHFMHSSQTHLRSNQTRILVLIPGWSENAPPSSRTVDKNHPHLPHLTQVTQVYKSPILISSLKGERRGFLE